MGRTRMDYKRTHFSIERNALARLDKLVGEKGRAAFVRMALDQALDTAEAAQRMVTKATSKTD